MESDGGKKGRIGEKGSALMEQISGKRDRALDLAFHGDCRFEKTGRQSFFECSETSSVYGRKRSAAAVKGFDDGIDLSGFDPVAVAFLARLN